MEARIALPGSEREPLHDAVNHGAVDPNDVLSVTVVLKPRGTAPAEMTMTAAPADRRYLSRAELAATRGASMSDVAAIERYALDHGFIVLEASVARRSVVLHGTVANAQAAFGVILEQYAGSGIAYRGRTGAIMLPASLVPIVEGVFGLDDRPQARTHFRRAVARPQAVTASYTPVEVARLYGFPSGQTANGQTIGLIELGGGFVQSDLDAYFATLDLPAPKPVAVAVDGGANAPTGDPSSADGEVMLDIEVAGAIATGASLVVYFAPNTDQGFLDAVTTAIHDDVNRPTVLSISWGGPESSFTAQARAAFDAAFADAGTLGMTICCASGDSGSSDGLSDGKAHVDFPSASPHVLACGGTSITASAGAIVAESVWNDTGGGATGGGISETFPLPAWQAGANVPPSVNAGHAVGRGVPDVAGNADPATGYLIRTDGQSGVVGGTSAVAPLWAALIALINASLPKPLGFINPLLYANPRALRDITSGSNGAYFAAPGWDACTGLGSPDGAKVAAVLTGSPVTTRS